MDVEHMSTRLQDFKKRNSCKVGVIKLINKQFQNSSVTLMYLGHISLELNISCILAQINYAHYILQTK